MESKSRRKFKRAMAAMRSQLVARHHVTNDMLLQEQQQLQHLFKQSPGFMCVLSGPMHVFTIANDAYYTLVGHREVIGRGVAEALPEVVEQGFLEKLDRVMNTGEPFIGRALPIALQLQADGPLVDRYIDLIYQPIREEGGKVTGIFVQGHDVTDAHQLARELKYQAAHDPLTGLVNRREFLRITEEIEQRDPSAGQQAQKVALLYIDLDQFKLVNDQCGHAAGDEMLRLFAEQLRQSFGESNFLARLGGDEFAVLLPDTDDEQAIRQAQRLRQEFEHQTFSWGTRQYSITLSVGVAIFPDDALQGFQSVVHRADTACLAAKEKGRNRVQRYCLSDLDLFERTHDMDWASKIVAAVRDDLITLHAQRIFPLQKSNRSGVDTREVLCRLLDENGDLVLPGVFIPAAERFGMIANLDRHVVRKVISRIDSLVAGERARTRYFINLSALTLNSDALIDFIDEILLDFPRFSPGSVCFEVTETAAVQRLVKTGRIMQQLVDRGFEFALDDFGSGMSSFSYLRQLPVHYVKIDGQFIQGVMTDKVSRAMVESVVRVARTMKIKTVAEFVDSVELCDVLRELGVDYAQGFALHRPEQF